MQKAAIVLLPVAFIAVIVAFFVLQARREPEGALGGPVGILKKGATSDSAAGGSDSARLRAEVETLRKEVEATRKRAEEAEARAARLESEALAAAPTAEPKKADVKKGDWKTRRDAELEAKVKSIDWRKRVKGLVDYWKELESARAEGRSPRMDPDMVQQLTLLSKDATELHKFLGMEGVKIYDSFKNTVVSEAWNDAFLQEMTGGSLTEAQLARLRETDLYSVDEPDFENGNTLEGWKWMIEHNQLYATASAGVLNPEQSAIIAKTVTPTFMLSVYAQYSERTVSGAPAVTDFWVSSFKLAAEQRATVEAVAGEFTKRLTELTQTYTSQYGATLPREADYELRLKALDLQIAAERRLVESLHLDAEQAKKLLRGSGSVLRLAN